MDREARTCSRAKLCRLSLVGLASGPPSRCFKLLCAACISVLLVRSRMNGTLLDWFSITLWAMAMDSLMVPKPLDPAIRVAKPTKYWQSLSVFQSDGEKSFLVSMLSRCRVRERRASFFVNWRNAGPLVSVFPSHAARSTLLQSAEVFQPHPLYSPRVALRSLRYLLPLLY